MLHGAGSPPDGDRLEGLTPETTAVACQPPTGLMITADGVVGVPAGQPIVIALGRGDSITIAGLHPNQLHASDFDFHGAPVA